MPPTGTGLLGSVLRAQTGRKAGAGCQDYSTAARDKGHKSQWGQGSLATGHVVASNGTADGDPSEKGNCEFMPMRWTSGEAHPHSSALFSKPV